MKSLIDLKSEIKNNKLNNLYVFTGPENYIRKIYYEKICEIAGSKKCVEEVRNIFSELETKSLIKRKKVYVCYNDLDFLKQKESSYEKFINMIKDNIVILIYDEIPDKLLFKNYFNDYITNFTYVEKDIAEYYVKKEANDYSLDDNFCGKIAFNCSNSYNSIVEEINKYKNYNSKDNLDCIFCNRIIEPTSKEFANNFLTNNLKDLYDNINAYKFFNTNVLSIIPELYSSLNICIFLKSKGKWDGGTEAYNSGEYWGRVKELRDMNIKYSSNDLNEMRIMIDKLDKDIRKGYFKAEHFLDWLVCIIL